jgi:hypothetical protein
MTSVSHSGGGGLPRAELDLLVPWFYHLDLVACCLLGVRILLPESLRIRSSISRASVSTA